MRAHARRDAFVAIRLVFPERAWPAARCVVRREGGRFKRVFVRAVGFAGEVGAWQWHPIHRETIDMRLAKTDALYATRKAVGKWRSLGERFRDSRGWYLSAKRCGVR